VRVAFAFLLKTRNHLRHVRSMLHLGIEFYAIDKLPMEFICVNLNMEILGQSIFSGENCLRSTRCLIHIICPPLAVDTAFDEQTNSQDLHSCQYDHSLILLGSYCSQGKACENNSNIQEVATRQDNALI
jgi:hypothetical protein